MLVALGLGACHPSTPVQVAAPPAPPPVTPLILPAPTQPGYQARIGVGSGPSTDDNWNDLFVSGTGQASKDLCEQAVKVLLESLASLKLGTTMLAPCSTAALPARIARGGSYQLFVNPDSGADTFMMIDSLLAAQTEEPKAEISVTQYARFSSASDCQGMLAKVAEAHQEAARQVAASSLEWLTHELAQLEQQRENSCQSYAEVSTRCDPLRKGQAAREACATDPAALVCKRAKTRENKLMRCEHELSLPKQLCDTQTKALEYVRLRLNEPPAPPEPVHASCQPG